MSWIVLGPLVIASAEFAAMIVLLAAGYRSLPQRVSSTLNIDTALTWSSRENLRMMVAAGDRRTTVPRTWLLVMTALMGWLVLSAWFRDARHVGAANIIIDVGLVLANAFFALFTFYTVVAVRRPRESAIGFVVTTNVARRLTVAFWCALVVGILYCAWVLPAAR